MNFFRTVHACISGRRHHMADSPATTHQDLTHRLEVTGGSARAIKTSAESFQRESETWRLALTPPHPPDPPYGCEGICTRSNTATSSMRPSQLASPSLRPPMKQVAIGG